MDRLHPDDIQALAEAVATKLAAKTDAEALMTAEELAALTRYSLRHATERVAKRPGFPAQVLPGRWRRRDVLQFLEDGAPRSGRKRASTQL